MADKRISELTALTGANVADTDLLPIVDTSAAETKKITFGEFKTALDTATGFVRITGDTMTGNLSFGGDNKAIFGAGSDLQIYHNGTNSIISDEGAGALVVQSNGSGIYLNNGVSENMLTAVIDGAVTLYHDNSPKLATTATGISVTGTASADQLNSNNGKLFLDDNGSHDGVINAPASLFINFDSDNTSASEKIVFGYDRDGTSGGTSVMEINSSGIDVTGTVVADGLTVDGGSGSGTITLGSTTNVNGALTYDISGNTSIYLDNNYQSINSNFFYRSHAAGTPRNHLKIAGNGDISFYEDTGTTAKFFWDASAESLGIGTSSPSTFNQYLGNKKLVIGDGTTRSGVTIYSSNGASDFGALTFADGVTGTEQYRGAVHYQHDNDLMKFLTAATERMRIDSSGNVLHTVASQGSAFVANTPSTWNALEIFQDRGITNSASGIAFRSQSGTAPAGIVSVAGNTTGGIEGLVFMTSTGNNTYERMRIDSSGNLLVGKTSTSYAVEGIALRSDNAGVMSTVTDEACFTANRLNSDGTLILFAKDTATVGSIGTYDSDISIGSTTCGVSFYDTSNSVLPFNRTTNGYSDNAVNLGQSNVRFKNLYLSGGVYLGGTGSANKLDDYEEGAWAPTITLNSGTATTYSTLAGNYTKTGRMVVVLGHIIPSNGTLGSTNGYVRMTGLPFTVPVSGVEQGVGSGLNASYLNSGVAGTCAYGTTVDVAFTSASASANSFRFVVTYFV